MVDGLHRPTREPRITLKGLPAKAAGTCNFGGGGSGSPGCDGELDFRPRRPCNPDPIPLSRLLNVVKKQYVNGASLEMAQSEERIEAIKSEIAQAFIRRNTLPNSASDEEKAAVAARVEQLQARHHEAVQSLLAIRRQETSKLEREHKEKKLRQKQLKASRQPGGQAVPHEQTAAPPRRSPARPQLDRAAEEALLDAANEIDLFQLRQEREKEGNESADELAQQRDLAAKNRIKIEADKRREAEQREKKEAESRAKAAQLKAEKAADARIRQQAALQREEETRARKREQRAEREAQQHAIQNARSSGRFRELLRQLKALFGGRR